MDKTFLTLFISDVLWHSPLTQSNFTASAPATILFNEFESYAFQIIATSPIELLS